MKWTQEAEVGLAVGVIAVVGALYLYLTTALAKLTLTATSYDPSTGQWAGVAKLTKGGSPVANALITAQISTDNGVSWTQTHTGPWLTDANGEALVYVTSAPGYLVRAVCSTESVYSDAVLVG